MSRRLHIQGQYADNGKEVRRACREAAGNKCIRCGHPDDASTGHVLTVHHFDGNKANDSWWNLMALCQRCHLRVQGRVNPEIPFFLEHSPWAKPYIAGFYAKKYEGRDITREEATERMEELLAYELHGGVRCRAADGERCDCSKCNAEFERQKAYWKPLYDGEKAAGLINRGNDL